MSLTRLSVHRFRNLREVVLPELAQINLVYGDNGSGKTSLLEAIYALGSARSFRTRKWKTLVQHGESDFIVSAEVLHRSAVGRLGVQRQLGESSPLVRVNGESVRAASELAGWLPLQVLDSAAFDLLEGPPEKRRQLLDWAVFHVEHNVFVPVWRRYQKALLHRNALLRGGLGPQSPELKVWTRELVKEGERIHQLRTRYFDALISPIEETYRQLSEGVSEPATLRLKYYPGWDAAKSTLAELWQQTAQRDIELGYTRDGPHRADLQVRTEGRPVIDVFSRGQLKTLVASFRLAQAKLLLQYGIKSVFLVDDLPAELDSQRRLNFCATLVSMGLQGFFTSIEAEGLAGCFPPGRTKRFHVKHGHVSPYPS